MKGEGDNRSSVVPRFHRLLYARPQPPPPQHATNTKALYQSQSPPAHTHTLLPAHTHSPLLPLLPFNPSKPFSLACSLVVSSRS